MEVKAGGDRRARAAVLLLLGAVAAACDRAGPVEPEPPGLMDVYVALGNSITAGFQSDGFHVEMQNQAYPVLLAAKAGVAFGVPGFVLPGCPPPIVAPLSTTRLGDEICAGRVLPLPPLVQNLAVPGATVAHALTATGTGSGLDFLILGPRSQVAAMAAAQPTLVSVWLGNNDALAAALQADTTRLTPLAAFQASYDAVVAAVIATPAQDAILIGVADAPAIAPALQPGAYFWAMADPASPLGDLIDADDNCAPGTPGGSRMVSFLTVTAQLTQNPAGPVVINCAEGAPFVLGAAELAAITQRVEAFNAHIQARAQANGWIYVDPTPDLFLPALQNPDFVRKCQGLATAQTPAQFAAAIADTCPGPAAPNFYGSYFSFDGVHPSSAGHVVIADVLAGVLNAKHGLGL